MNTQQQDNRAPNVASATLAVAPGSAIDRTPRTDALYAEIWTFVNEAEAEEALAKMRDLARELECEVQRQRNQIENLLKPMRDKLAEENEQLRAAYKRLHAQVGGYLSGREWDHWQQYNEPRYAPAVALSPNDKGEPRSPRKRTMT